MTNGNEPAFALEKSRAEQSTPDPTYGRGLTKREYFAVMAMQGICVQGAWSRQVQQQSESIGSNSSEAIATYAVDIADALIAALNTTKQQDNG